jgi:hypothetical protein
VLLPRLSGWISQLADENRYPALEQVLARAHVGPPLAGQLDPLRLQLFGLPWASESESEVPVAALGLLAGGIIPATDRAYHLRLDPVSLQADISRVMLMRSGFGGFSTDYQQHVKDIVKQVLADDGLEVRAAADFWTLTLPQHPAVLFTPLDDALGADLSDCLPEGAAGRHWKRLANEIQMALHASPVNEQRRQRGEALINGVWFWGGGQLPERVASCGYERVYSIDPVSAGLARLNDIPVALLSELLDGLQADASALAKLPASSILVDWAIPASSEQLATLMLTPAKLEAFCAAALVRLKQQGGVLELHSPEISLRLTPARLRRFWRRPKPLLQQLTQLLRSVMPTSQEAP